MTQTYSDNNIEATNGFAALITAIALVIAYLFFSFLGFNVSLISFTFAVVIIFIFFELILIFWKIFWHSY